MKRFFSDKKRLLIIILWSIFSLGIVLVILLFKFLNPFKPSFYTYSSYADSETVKNINKHYTYKEYGTAKEFEYYFSNNKAISGVTSDYLIINLINSGKVAPIRKDIEQINKFPEGLWDSFWSDEAIDQMNYYNSYIDQEILKNKYPEYGQNYIFKFSDFVVPYFINDRLIAFDTKKVMNGLNLGINPLEFQKIPTLEEALKKLSEINDNIKIQWTKNEMENVAMGSTINNPESEWDTKITNKNSETLLNNFAQIVQKGTGASMSDVKRNIFDNDSDIILNNLINPTSKIKSAIIYNGDALDAYYGNDNFKEIIDGDRVRIIRTKYTLRILDCFIVTSSISNKERKVLLENFNQTLFNGMFYSEKKLEEINQIKNVYEMNGIMRIFDYVNYTPAAKGPEQYIYNNYFLDDDGQQDEIARDIYKVSVTNEVLGIYVKPLDPIKPDVLSKIIFEFQKKINGH